MASSVISRIMPCLVRALLLPLLHISHCSSPRCHWDFICCTFSDVIRKDLLLSLIFCTMNSSLAWLHLRFQAQATGLGCSHKGTEKASDQFFSVSVDLQWNMRCMSWSASSDKQTKEQMSTISSCSLRLWTRHITYIICMNSNPHSNTVWWVLSLFWRKPKLRSKFTHWGRIWTSTLSNSSTFPSFLSCFTNHINPTREPEDMYILPLCCDKGLNMRL